MKYKLNLKDIENEILKEPVEVGDLSGKKIIFSPNISCKKALSFCERASNIILSVDGVYIPQLSKILAFYFIVNNLTNIPVKKDKSGNFDIDFLYNLMISDVGYKIIEQAQIWNFFSFLSEEINKIVSYKKEVHFSKISPINKTLENIDNLIFDVQNSIQKISSFTDEHKNFMSSGNFTKMIETLENIKTK